MRLVWELFRVAWAVGCLPIGALLLVVVVFSGFNLPFFLGFPARIDPAIRGLFWALILYIVGGGWLFWQINQIYAAKLKRLAVRHQGNGFKPQVEVFAKINDAYLGIDGESGKLLAYPVNGTAHFFRLADIRSWHIIPVGKRNYRLNVLTSDLNIPVFSMALPPHDAVATEARLHAVFGT